MTDDAKRYKLSKEQAQIALSPPDLPQLVLAPPGTGKTHTVIARITYLVAECGLDPASELLVLSFSRAAAKVITTRLTELVLDEDLHDDFRFLMVRTFDSFATRLLMAAAPERDLDDLDFDSRIELVVEQLKDTSSPESAIVRNYKHIIVDEIQDLVGVRASLVKLMIERISGAFTLLGDPAQGIYSFSLRDQDDKTTSDDLIKWVNSSGAERELQLRELKENFRTQGDLGNFINDLRGELLDLGNDPRGSLGRLSDALEPLESLGSSSDLGRALKEHAPSGSVCILCRTNGEALQVASLLSQVGTPFAIRPNLDDKGLPPWIGRVLGTWKTKRMTQAVFQRRWEELVGVRLSGTLEPETAWHWLKRVEARDASDLDVIALHAKLWHGAKLPDEADAFLMGKDAAAVSLSTVHAAKGREFDKVVLLDSAKRTRNGDEAEEARILYVAATRARKDLQRLGRQGIAWLRNVKLENGASRWVASSRSKKGTFHFMEVGAAHDFDGMSPVSTWLRQSPGEASAAQDYLWSHVHPGTAVCIRKERRGRYVFYRVLHPVGGKNPMLIGQMSLSFKSELGETLRIVAKKDKVFYPKYMDPIQVAAVVTEVLPPYPENVQEPFATSGFCLGLRLRGMGYIYKE